MPSPAAWAIYSAAPPGLCLDWDSFWNGGGGQGGGAVGRVRVTVALGLDGFLWAEVDTFDGSGVLGGDAQDVDELFLCFLVAPQLQQ